MPYPFDNDPRPFGGPAPAPGGGGGGALQRFAGIFGTMSPADVVQQRQAGNFAPPTGPQMSAPAPRPQPASSGYRNSPEQASWMQSMAPGVQNGNEANGYHDPAGSVGRVPMSSSAQTLQGQLGTLPPAAPPQYGPQQFGQAPPPIAAPPQAAVQAGLAGLPPTIEGPAKMGSLDAQVADAAFDPDRPWQNPEDERGFRAMFGEARPNAWSVWDQDRRQQWKGNNFDPLAPETPATPALPAQGASQEAQDGVVQQLPPTTTDAPKEAREAAQPGGTSAEGYTGPGGNFKPWAEADWRNFRESGGDPRDFIANAPNWNEGFWANAIGMTKDERRKVSNLPPAGEGGYSHPTGLDVAGRELPDNYFDAGSPGYIENEGVRDLGRKAMEWTKKIHELMQAPPSQRPTGELDRLWSKLNPAVAALEKYGINFDPGAEGATEDQFPRRDELADTELGGELPSFTANSGIWKDAMRAFGGDTPEQRAAAAQFYGDLWGQQYALDTQQKGVNVLDRALGEYQDDPGLARAQGIADDIAANPNPVDFTALRNQAAEDQANRLSGLTGQLSDSFARRGLTAASGAGLQAETNRAASRDLARLLGDLNVQEGVMNRQGQLEGINALSGVAAQRLGGESQLSQALANAIMGAPSTPFNPASSVTDLQSGLSALDLLRDQQDEQEKQNRANTYIGGANALANVLGSLPKGGG